MTGKDLVIVTGSGRSGTSLVSGLLQRLGCRVPTPEVPADATNPRGFAESQWVVDLHTRLLLAAGVQVSDARPGAWARTAPVGLDAGVHDEVLAFLREQFAQCDAVVLKDPRMSWFLPLWRRAAQELGVAPRIIVMLRHPAAVVASKQHHYGGAQGEASRTAGWINQTLFTERATRDVPRVFLRYGRLLEDWTSALAQTADTLDLAVVRDAPAPAIRRAHEFLDVSLDRSLPQWHDLAVPAPTREIADAVWEAATADTVDEPRFDDLRERYTALYAEAEAVAYSSIAAATSVRSGPRPSLPLGARRVLRRVPRRVRHALPRRVRTRIVRAVAR